MNNSRKKIAVFCLTSALCTGLLSAPAYSYDGDIDYLAPYVTLDPESGKLVTIDPRKDAAVAKELEQLHNAKSPATTTSTDTSTTAPVTDTSVAAVSAPADTAQQTVPKSTGTAVIAAIGGILIIGVIVAMTRRKSSPKAGDSTT